MKFDVNKAALRDALNTVHNIAKVLVMPNAGSDKAVSSQGGLECVLSTDKDKLYVAYSSGQLFLRAEAKGVTVHKPGSVLINSTTYLNALKVSGEMFKGSVNGSKMSITCGRSRASLDVFKGETSVEPPKGSPKLKLLLQRNEFAALLSAVSISADRPLVRTLHFSKGVLRAECDDQYRAVVAKAKAKGLDESGAVMLSEAVANAILPHLTDKVNLGWNDKVLAIQCPGKLYACVPLHHGNVRDLAKMLTGFVEKSKKMFSVVVDAGEVSRALSDVSTLVDDLTDVIITFDDKKGVISSRLAKDVESDFDVVSSSLKKGKEARVYVTVSKLTEALSVDGKVTIDSYSRDPNGFITVSSAEQEGLQSYLCSIPQLPAPAASKKKGKGKGKDEEEDGDEEN